MRRLRSALFVITVNNLIMALGFRVWRSIFNNFAVEELAVQANQIGLIQAIREIPGLIGVVVALLALFLTEMRIAGISVIVMGDRPRSSSRLIPPSKISEPYLAAFVSEFNMKILPFSSSR